jgi:hypothetical protein
MISSLYVCVFSVHLVHVSFFFFAEYMYKTKKMAQESTEKVLQQSDEMDFSRLDTITHDKPFDVFYQSEYSDGWNTAGFSFNIFCPAYNALLSRDIWIECTFDLQEEQAYGFTGMFEDNTREDDDPRWSDHLAFRQGNILARSMEDFRVNINNFQMNYTPSLYMDVWNRLHVSTAQSEHEFSASGGKFDTGNHSERDGHTYYAANDNRPGAVNEVPNTFNFIDTENSGNGGDGNTTINVTLYEGFCPNYETLDNPNRDLICQMRPLYPILYDFYNEGLGNRFSKLASLCNNGASLPYQDVSADPGHQYQVDPADANGALRKLRVTIFERLPIPLFKMYTLDEVQGVIPNISQLQLQAKFLNNLVHNWFRYGHDIDDPSVSIQITNSHYCKIHLKWFIPSFEIPKEIKIQYPKFITKCIPFQGKVIQGSQVFYVDQDLAMNYISLPAIPDLMLMYVKYDPHHETCYISDDYNLELLNPQFSLNVANSKLLNIQSIQAYHLWKQNLKYKVESVMGFDEWRKYCFVLVLKPEDFGLKIKREYNEPCIINFKATARNWHIIPSAGYGIELYIGTASQNLVFVCHGVYFRNELEIRKDRAFEILKTM